MYIQPKQLFVAPIDSKVARQLITRYHYTRYAPPATLSFGVWHDKRVVGAVIYRSPNGSNPVVPISRRRVIELARVWLHDDCGPNCESFVIARTVKALRALGQHDLIVSYADSTAGHIGTIYQALGWYYLGESVSVGVRIGEKLYFSRSVANRFKTRGLNALKRITGEEVENIRLPPKYTYVWPLCDSARTIVEDRAKPYPRRRKESLVNRPASRRERAVQL